GWAQCRSGVADRPTDKLKQSRTLGTAANLPVRQLRRVVPVSSSNSTSFLWYSFIRSGACAVHRQEPVRARKVAMAEIKFTLNGKPTSVNVNPKMPLLWALRDTLGMTGTKFGCGMQLCGACTVHLEGQPVRSCGTPVSSIAGKKVTTIEGLSADSRHPIQQAWIEEDVPQCGYCQSGQIMTAAGLLAKKANPTETDID